MLAVSRALGDLILQPYVSAEPEIKKIMVSNKHKLLILACDGLWDVVGDQEAVTLCATEDDPAQVYKMCLFLCS
jgi:serine/threonine protein phosphatase PrpC